MTPTPARCVCCVCAALLAPEESHKHYEWHAAIERMIALATAEVAA